MNSKIYKGYIIKTLVFSGIGWLSLQLVIYFLCRPPEWYWIHDTFKIKENIANKIPGNKIVFVGGSATLFGLRTEDVERELKIPTINYGVHAGLDIDYILERAKKILKPGDVVILPLEYSHLLYDGRLNEVRTRFVLLFDENYYKSLSYYDKIRYFFKFSPLTIEFTFWSTFWKIFGNNQCFHAYDVNTLNNNGDETNNLGNSIIKNKYNDIQPIAIQKGKFQETVGLKIIENFNIWCLEHNIKCFVTYAPIISLDVYYSSDYHIYFNSLQNYFSEHHIDTIGFPNDFFYKLDYFYDSIYHLNSTGMTINTRYFITKLKNLFKYYKISGASLGAFRTGAD